MQNKNGPRNVAIKCWQVLSAIQMQIPNKSLAWVKIILRPGLFGPFFVAPAALNAMGMKGMSSELYEKKLPYKVNAVAGMWQ